MNTRLLSYLEDEKGKILFYHPAFYLHALEYCNHHTGTEQLVCFCRIETLVNGSSFDKIYFTSESFICRGTQRLVPQNMLCNIVALEAFFRKDW